MGKMTFSITINYGNYSFYSFDKEGLGCYDKGIEFLKAVLGGGWMSGLLSVIKLSVIEENEVKGE